MCTCVDSKGKYQGSSSVSPSFLKWGGALLEPGTLQVGQLTGQTALRPYFFPNSPHRVTDECDHICLLYEGSLDPNSSTHAC